MLFPGILINDEAVSEDRFVRSHITNSDTEHEGALEPPTVLVGSLEVKIGRAIEFGMGIKNGNVR